MKSLEHPPVRKGVGITSYRHKRRKRAPMSPVSTPSMVASDKSCLKLFYDDYMLVYISSLTSDCS